MSSEPPSGPNGRPSKSVVRQPATVVESQPWWANSQIRWALGVIVSGIAVFLRSWGLLPFLTSERLSGVVALICSVGGLIWLLKRVKFGKDPSNPAPPITLT